MNTMKERAPISIDIKAVIVATDELPAEMSVLPERYPCALLPLLDKPFVQHVVEFLVSLGVGQFDVLASHRPDKIKALLGDGRRWGVTIKHHLIKEPQLVMRMVKQIADSCEAADILLANGATWPSIELNTHLIDSANDVPRLYYVEHSDRTDNTADLMWSGWALFPARSLSRFSEGIDEHGFVDYLNAHPQLNKIVATHQPFLSVRTIDDLFQSHFNVLDEKRSDLTIRGNQAEKGIWLGRNVRLHPNARLAAPVWIGENCNIDRGVKLGPYSVVGNDCILSEHSILEETIIFPGSFVGENLELTETLVDRNCMVNRRLNSELIVAENFILSGLGRGLSKGRRINILSRAAAAILTLCFAPWWLFLWGWGRINPKNYGFDWQAYIRMPAEPDPFTWQTGRLFCFRNSFSQEGSDYLDTVLFSNAPAGWRDFLFRVIPALINIVRGEICFVGVTPRSEEQIKRLPSDWRSLYLKCKPGIITESQINFGSITSNDQLYSADAFYSVSSGMLYDAKLLSRYLLQLLGLESPPQS